MILIVTNFMVKRPHRVKAVGWVCLIFAVSVFAAPLSIMASILYVHEIMHSSSFFFFFFIYLFGLREILKTEKENFNTANLYRFPYKSNCKYT